MHFLLFKNEAIDALLTFFELLLFSLLVLIDLPLTAELHRLCLAKDRWLVVRLSRRPGLTTAQSFLNLDLDIVALRSQELSEPCVPILCTSSICVRSGSIACVTCVAPSGSYLAAARIVRCIIGTWYSRPSYRQHVCSIVKSEATSHSQVLNLRFLHIDTLHHFSQQ